MNELNAELLAPGTAPGRLTLYTQAAIAKLEKEKLFTEQRAKPAKKATKTAKKPAKKEATKPAPIKKAPVAKPAEKEATPKTEVSA